MSLHESGFEITAPVFAPDDVTALTERLGLGDHNAASATVASASVAGAAGRMDGVRRGGQRPRLAEHHALRALATSSPMFTAAARVLGAACFPVRAIFFDKTPDANWKVTWHQDLTIAVRERRDVDGFGPWTEKSGIPHVQPPVSVLERMITVRLHLDDCHADNGPVRVIPGSHATGRRLSADDIAQWRERVSEVVCAVDRGGLLVMRPLLLHASSPSVVPARRRVVHIEYAIDPLPGGLEWFERASASAGDPHAGSGSGSNNAE